MLCIPRMLSFSTWSKMALYKLQLASRGERKGEGTTWVECPSFFGLFFCKANILVGTVAGEVRFSFQNTVLAGFIPDAGSISGSFIYFLGRFFNLFTHGDSEQQIVYCISVLETLQASLKFSPIHVINWEFYKNGLILYSLLLEQLL